MAHTVALLYVQSGPLSRVSPSLQLSLTDAKQVVTFTTHAANGAWTKSELEKLAADRVIARPVSGSILSQFVLTVHPNQPTTFDALLSKLAPVFRPTHREYIYSSQPPNPNRVELTIKTPEGSSKQIAIRVRRGDRPFSMEVVRPFMQDLAGLGLIFRDSDIDGWYFFQAPRQLPRNFRDKIVTHYAKFDSGFYKQ